MSCVHEKVLGTSEIEEHFISFQVLEMLQIHTVCEPSEINPNTTNVPPCMRSFSGPLLGPWIYNDLSIYIVSHQRISIVADYQLAPNQDATLSSTKHLP